jgi:hypothetical protein
MTPGMTLPSVVKLLILATEITEGTEWVRSQDPFLLTRDLGLLRLWHSSLGVLCALCGKKFCVVNPQILDLNTETTENTESSEKIHCL